MNKYGNIVNKQINNWVWIRFGEQTYNRISDHVWRQTYDRVRQQVSSQTGIRIKGLFWAHV
jgi:hypothetical protein